MNLILFIVTIAISVVVVRIGAIAFEMTGLEWSLAQFQALSCFTGTGFTTREAELITGHLQRRRIASVLMVLGSAGLVTLIATFANSLRTDVLMPKFTMPFLHLVFSSRMLPWVNLIIIGISVYVTYRIFTSTRFARQLTSFLRNRIVKKEIIRKMSFEELVIATGGYGISKIEIYQDNPLIDKTLLEAELRKQDVTVLAVERGKEIIPNPPAKTRILTGDKLVCFGKLENIRKTLSAVSN